MPISDAFGQCLCGTGGLPGSIDRRPYPFSSDGGGCWIDDDGRPDARILVQLQPQTVLATWTPWIDGAKPQVIRPERGAHFVAGGGGRWIALLAPNPRLGTDALLYGNTIGDRPFAGAGDVAEDGTIVYKTKYFADFGLTIVPPNGPEIDLPSALPVDFQALSGGKAIWRGGAYGREPVKPALPASGLQLVTIRGIDWLIYWHSVPDEDSLGVIAQVDGATEGYILEPHPIAFRRSSRNVGGQLFVAWSIRSGEAPEDLRTMIVNRLNPRVPLVPRVSTPPIPTPPRPTPTPPPPPPPPKPKPTPPKPTPIPTPPVHQGDFLMFSIFADPTKQLLAVKAVKTLSGVTVLENPDGTIVSIQPDGRVESRPAGADGGYERCKISGNAATFKPASGKYYTFAFVIVEGL